MGADIHMYLEKKVGGKWVSAEQVITDPEWDIVDVPRDKRIYAERNYLLFSILAGVREPIPGIWQKYPVKGFPDDADPSIRQVYARWGEDAHTASYLTLKDLEDVDWGNEGVPLQYDVTARQKEIYEYFKTEFFNKNGGFVQGAWKPSKPYLINSFMYDTIKDPWISLLEYVMKPENETPLTKIWAYVPLYLVCDEFWDVIVKLKTMADNEHLTHDDIRLVFWFDN